MSDTSTFAAAPAPGWRELYRLCKPKVVALIVFTALVGMLLAPGEQITLLKLLGASLLAYGLPLLALVVAPVAADRLWGPFGDAGLAAIGAGALAAAIVAGRRLLARDRCLERLVPDLGHRASAAARDA